MEKDRKFGAEGSRTAAGGGQRDAAEAAEASGAAPPALPRPPPASGLSGRLANLAETAKAYARSAQADNTRRAYSVD